MKKYPITYWMGIPEKFLHTPDGNIDRSRIEEMKEAGFTLIDTMHSPEDNKKVLEIAEELGLQVQVYDWRITEAVYYDSKRRPLLEKIVADYKDYPALHSYHIWDEPSENLFNELSATVEILKELDPEHEAYINLLPNYAIPEQLGHPNYETHLEDFIARVKPEMISYDHYNLFKPGTLTVPDIEEERERMIFEAACKKQERPGFYDNFEIVRRISQKHGLPYMIIVLLVEHGPYRNLTEAEIRWEVFQSLAYGTSRMCYFTYWTPGVDGADNDASWNYQNGMISKGGERLPHYDMVKNINKELSAMGDLLVGKKNLEVFHTNDAPETETRLFTSYGNIEKLEGDTVVVGFFEDDYVVIANRSYEQEANIKLTVKKGCNIEILETESGEWISLDAEGDFCNIVLDAGDGMMLRIR